MNPSGRRFGDADDPAILCDNDFGFDRMAFLLAGIPTVRRHINWNKHGPDLKEDLAHLFQDIKRRICGVASAGFPSFFV